MTISASDGPYISIGAEQPLGTANQPVGVAGLAPYISGTAENPDAGPNCWFGANMLKDPLYRYQRGRGPTLAGGYPNQALGFIDHYVQTIDFAPSAIANANIATTAANATVTSGTPMTLVSATGAGITVLAASFTVQNSGLVIPSGRLLIDNAPNWASVSYASGAMRAFDRTACGRAVSITGGSAGSVGGHFLVSGYDLYGRPQTENINATAGAVTTNGAKGWKWLTSVVPQFNDAHSYSVGTTDIYEFPLRADKYAQVNITWNNTTITSNAGFVAAVTTPANATSGSVRGTWAVQTSASNGTIQLQVEQILPNANISGANYLTGLFGVLPA